MPNHALVFHAAQTQKAGVMHPCKVAFFPSHEQPQVAYLVKAVGDNGYEATYRHNHATTDAHNGTVAVGFQHVATHATERECTEACGPHLEALIDAGTIQGVTDG